VNPNNPNNNADRYHRQTLLPQIGPEGQARLSRARVLLVGCGALGTVIAEQLVRAGVGTLHIVDRDVVELSNLQRQTLFDESDAAEGVPKAVAAKWRLNEVNSTVKVRASVVDFHAGNAEELDENAELVLDGTDNVETRYLINELCMKYDKPWVYGACVGMEGRVMTVVPRTTACLRCVFPEPPGPGELPTCDTAGVFGPLAGVVASLQSIAAIKLLSGNAGAIRHELTTIDAWTNRFRTIDLTEAKRPDCPTCGLRRFEQLERGTSGQPVSLCGRNAVQVRPNAGIAVKLESLASKLEPFGVLTRTPYLLRLDLRDDPALRLTVFPDGRLIVAGTTDVNRARSLYARYIGA
jgi:adenylyltransferase/sulfurtransferase